MITRLFIALLFVNVAISQAAAQAQTIGANPLIPSEAFFGPADVLGSNLSPSGRFLAVTTAISGGRTGLFVFDLENRGAASKVARFTDLDIRDFNWINDERLTFNVIDLKKGLGVQGTNPSLFSVKIDGSELRELIGFQYRTTDDTNRTQPLDWRHVGLTQIDDDEEIIIAKRVFTPAGDITNLIPMRLNIITGRTRPIKSDPPDDIQSWWFNAKGEPKVAVSTSGPIRKIYWRESQQSDWRLIAQGATLSLEIWPRFVDSNNNLYVEHAPEKGTSVLTRFDFSTNKPAAEATVSTPGFDFRGTPIFDGRSEKLIGLNILTDARTTVWFDQGMKATQKLADDRWPGYVNSLTCRRCGQPDMIVQVVVQSDTDPGQVWIYKVASKEWQAVTKVRSGIDPNKMASVDFVRIKARDGLVLPLWLTIPRGRKLGDSGPAVVIVHSGPWQRGSEWGWKSDAQFLASRGYLVISPEFRGGTGFGQKHYEAGFRQWGQAMQDDIADATLWAKQKGYANKFCIAGAGYGGYSALMGLINNPELFQCAIASLAIADPLLFIKGSWRIFDEISDNFRKYSARELIGDPEKDLVMLKANSPVEQASRIRAPLLLAYGGEDKYVLLEHGTRLRSAMQKAGLNPQWVVYPDEGHGFLLKESQLDFAKKMEDFLDANLKKK